MLLLPIKQTYKMKKVSSCCVIYEYENKRRYWLQRRTDKS